MSWKTRVWEHVREFREQHHCSELENLPVDAVFVADVELRLDLIPLAGLSSKYRVEAALTADFTGIYVDEEIFDLVVWGWRIFCIASRVRRIMPGGSPGQAVVKTSTV